MLSVFASLVYGNFLRFAFLFLCPPNFCFLVLFRCNCDFFQRFIYEYMDIDTFIMFIRIAVTSFVVKNYLGLFLLFILYFLPPIFICYY